MKTRDAILDTARRLFNEQGTRAVTTNHIAAAAGISPGNLYYHFKNRESIIVELFDRMEADECIACQDKSGLTTLPGLEIYYRKIFAVYRNYRFLLRESFNLMQNDGVFRDRYLSYLNDQVMHVAGAIATLVERGIIKPLSEARIQSEAKTISLILTGWFNRISDPGEDAWIRAEEEALGLVGQQAILLMTQENTSGSSE